jgi:hypothetical protein
MGTRDDSNLVWKIAAGVFIALITLGVVRGCVASYAEQQAMEQFNDTMRRIGEESRRAAYKPQRANTAQRPPTQQPVPLRADERCIGKQRFRRVPNGWEQIGSC